LLFTEDRNWRGGAKMAQTRYMVGRHDDFELEDYDSVEEMLADIERYCRQRLDRIADEPSFGLPG
jgi:hypothetical protein